MKERGIVQGIGPQREVHRCGPSSSGMQHLLACALGEVADAALGNAILKMGIDTANGELLLSVVVYLFEGVV